MSHVHAFSCIHTLLFLSFDIKYFWSFFDCLSLRLISLFLMLVASWHLNVNPFRPKTLFVLRLLLLLLLLTPLHLTYGSMMRRSSQTSQRTFHDEVFIRNAKSFCQIFLTLTYPLSSTVEVGSYYVASRSYALP